jgi:hypothetical protein
MTRARSVVADSHRRSAATLQKSWPGATLVDVTSKGSEPWVRFSPFGLHGGLPIPNSPKVTAQSVEGTGRGIRGPRVSGVKRTASMSCDVIRAESRFHAKSNDPVGRPEDSPAGLRICTFSIDCYFLPSSFVDVGFFGSLGCGLCVPPLAIVHLRDLSPLLQNSLK